MTSRLFDGELLLSQVERIKKAFQAAIIDGSLEDVAFIGNASGLYPWEPGLITDLDVCVFVRERNESVGLWLSRLRKELKESLELEGTQFDIRIVRGAYKHPVSVPERPVIIAHTGVFSEESYLQLTNMLRWAWRKYKCHVEPDRLARLATEKPSVDDFMNGRGGVLQRLQTIRSGQAPMREYVLPHFYEHTWTVALGEPLFAEYCLSAAATCSRNHGRLLERIEADTLSNRDFARWYNQQIFHSDSLVHVFAWKERVRQEGYGQALLQAPALANAYLSALYAYLCDRGSSTR